MKTIFYCIFAFFLPSPLLAQNLVRNPSFEQHNSCNYTDSESYDTSAYHTNSVVRDWFSPSSSTPDYFNRCNIVYSMSVPENFVSYQQPLTGNAYSGIFLYSQYRKNDIERLIYREYLQTRLISLLSKNKYYCVSFFLSQGYDAIYGNQMLTDDVSVSLTTNRITNYREDYLNPLPTSDFSLRPPNSLPIGKNTWATDTSKWYKISTIYQAKGGEEWFTIGNFKNNEDTNLRLLYASNSLDTLISKHLFESYIYIDDVSVTPLNIPPLLSVHDTTVCGGGAFPITAATGFSAYLWNTGDTSRNITITEAGTYWVRGSLDECGSVTDTIHVRQKLLPTLALADTVVCSTKLPILYTAPATSNTLNWSTHDTGNSTTIAAAGNYSATATNECGSSSTSFTVSVEPPLMPIHFSTIDTTSCLNGHFQPFHLSAPYGYPNYRWNTGETSRSIVATHTQTYTVSSENECGEVHGSREVLGCAPSYYLPNTFSPNGDGKNDFFTLYSNDAVRLIKLFQVFDRYGEAVFSAENIAPNDDRAGWNGSFRGQNLTPDVFAYRIVVEYADGKTEVFTGDVTIIL